MLRAALFILLFFPLLIAAQVKRTPGDPVAAPTDTSGLPRSTYAIVIGVSKYKLVRPELKFADRDARVFADFLVSKEGMGIDPKNVSLFVDSNATAFNIGCAITDVIAKKSKKGDRVIFFFAGHGDYDAHIYQDQALLLLYGALKENYFQSALSGDFISTTNLNQNFVDPLIKRDCEVMLIIDACHAGGLDQKLSGGAEGGKITMEALQNISSPIKIYSCRAKEYSREGVQWGGGRGLFSYELMEGLYGMADADHNKVVTLKELQRYLEDTVPERASPEKQHPLVQVENPDEVIATVNEAFLANYKKQKSRHPEYLASADLKGAGADWLSGMTDKQKKLYSECDSLIGLGLLDKAYEKFLLFAKTDSTSDESLHLRRNLSAALQSKTASVLTPLLPDVANLNASDDLIAEAEKQLEKATALLGEKHFLHNDLQARILFLQALLIYRKSPKKAIPLLTQSVRLEPNAAYSYFYLGYCYDVSNHYDSAAVLYRKYLDLIPTSAIAYNNLGGIYMEQKFYSQALINLQKSISLDSTFPTPYANIGIIYDDMRDFPKALSYINTAISFAPDQARYYYFLGNIFYDSADYRIAISKYRHAIALDSVNPYFYGQAAQAFYHLKNYDSSISYDSRAIALDSGVEGYYIYRGNAQYINKNYPEAIRDYEKAVLLAPYDANALTNLGDALFYGGDSVKAMVAYTQALDINPDKARAHRMRAYLFLQRKFYPKAVFDYQAAIRLDSGNSIDYYNLSCIYSIQKDPNRAMAYLDSALRYNYRNLANLETDGDLNNIRQLPGFSSLLSKYFTKDELDKHPKILMGNR